MSSQLRVDNILPSAGTALGIGTASGSITFNSNISGNTIFNNDITVSGVLTYEDVTNIDSVGVVTARNGLHVTGGSVGIGTDDPQEKLTVAAASPAVLINATSGSGESKLQFGRVGNTNIGEIKYEHSSDAFSFRTNDTADRLRIDSAGNITLGLNGSSLHFQNGFNNSTARIQNGGGSNNSELKFLVKDAGTESEKMRLTSTAGLAVVTAGSMTANAGNETLWIQGEGHNGHGTGNTRSVVSIIGALNSNASGIGIWIGAKTNENTAVIGTRTANGHLAFETYSGGWGERMRLTNGGYLGVNTASPQRLLHLHDGAATGLKITNTQSGSGSSDGFDIYIRDDNQGIELVQRENSFMTFHTNNTEKLRIDSSGRCLIGAISSSSAAKLAVNGSVGNTEAFFELNRTDDPANGQNIGIIEFCQGNAASRRAARLITRRDGGVWGAASLPSRFEFHTCSSGSNTPTERLRISSDGTTTFTGQRHKFIHNNSGGVGAYLSLFNTNATIGSSTGICFGVGGSDAVLDGTDYGESQIKVYNDSGLYGNMEINLHTGANRSYLKIVGNGAAFSGASAGTEGMVGGVAFGNAGIAIDRSWYGQPGIHVFNQNVVGDTDQGTFRFHGWNTSYASYPGRSGSDFGVSLIADGMTLTSDRRRKTGITTITDALNTVSQMRGVSFTYVNQDLEPQTHMSMDNGKKLGFIAQEVIPLLPELILDSGEKAVELENGYCDRYNMDYGGVAPLLVEAIKELKAKNEVLEARIAALE